MKKIKKNQKIKKNRMNNIEKIRTKFKKIEEKNLKK